MDEAEGALWQRRYFDVRKPAPDLARIVVGVDVATTSGEEANETGIIVAGRGVDGKGYVMADRSCRLSPDGWANRAVAAYHQSKADRIIAEANQGGEMITAVLRTVDPNVPVKLIHASRGKAVRAEPIAALYEQGKVFHVVEMPELEDQLCQWTPDSGTSPDRLDALVHALTELFPSSGGLRVW